ncbi:MAG TPA: hypothetical protein VHA37_04470 [Candidatus Saccharimonadales bacterium]|nr:hypothetical protein [Candidatus Saccharimonadales bacterium]
MSSFELLQAEVALLMRRVKQLEQLGAFDQALVVDRRAAVELAKSLGIPPEVITMRGPVVSRAQFEQRKRLARALDQDLDWSGYRIARLFNCWERTVTRWLRRQ